MRAHAEGHRLRANTGGGTLIALALAARAEYLHSEDGTLGIADGLVAEGGAASLDELGIYSTRTDLWSWTLTAGFDTIENLLLRLEYRLDVVSGDGGDIDGDARERNLTDSQSIRLALDRRQRHAPILVRPSSRTP